MYQKTLLNDVQRTALAADPDLGCGNFLSHAVRTSPAPDAPFFALDRPLATLTGETLESLSLESFSRLADSYAAWYFGNGVREKDPVAVYVREGIPSLVHFVALTRLGAIPVLINGNMRAEIAAAFLEKVGAVALFTDSPRLKAVVSGLKQARTLRFIATDESAATLEKPKLSSRYPYKHAADDIVLIGHSSGTTGIPKAVIFHHQQFFYGVRYRLSLPRLPGSERVLSALPHSHSAGIAYVMLAVLSGAPVMVLSDNRPETVLNGIDWFRPSMVAAFPETYVELTEHGFAGHDLSCLRIWINGGDAAHETHIRKLLTVGRWNKNGEWKEGSLFVDGLGSSELGFSLFRNIHTPESDNYQRCIGTPLEWVDAAALGEDGEKLPPYRIGRLGVKSPTITPGYWNDSLLTAKTRVSGYWLTGDLAYCDEKGRFFHVDRIPDAIITREGTVYSLWTEELLMRHCPEIGDISVIAAVKEGKGTVPVAMVRPRAGARLDRTAWLKTLNGILERVGKKPNLAAVLVRDPKEVPLGPTGKVLKRELRDQLQDALKPMEVA